MLLKEVERLMAENSALRARNETLEQRAELAFVDTLTGVPNRRAFDHALERELGRAERGVRPLSLVLMDVDHFKKVNDEHGHQVGDQVLRRLGHLLGRSVRHVDFVGRYGGEEFVFLFPSTGDTDAWAFVERLRRNVFPPNLHFIGSGGQSFTVTVSFGIAEWWGHGEDASMLIERADRALYEAKRQGRNCAVIAD